MVAAAALVSAASIALAACTCGLALWSAITMEVVRWQEGRLKGLKVARMVSAFILLASQAAVLIVQVLQNSGSRLCLAEQSCALAALFIVLAALCGVLLVQCGSLLASDILQLTNDGGDSVGQAAIVALAVHASQILLLLGLLLTELIIGHGASLSTDPHTTPFDSSVHEPLLEANANGTANLNGDSSWCGTKAALGADGEPAPKKVKAKKAPALTRWQMTAAAMRYVWPASGPLRVRLLFCFILVIMERAVNLAVPWSQKQMIDRLTQVSAVHTHIGPLLAAAARNAGSTGAAGTASAAAAALAAGAGSSAWNSTAQALAAGGVQAASSFGRQLLGQPTLREMVVALIKDASKVAFWPVFYPYVLAYLGFYFLRGGSGSEGLLANIRDLVWIPITQAAFRRISMDIFGHLLELDHNFHLHRKTGQIMRILDRGTSSIQDTVTIVLFNVVPQLIDIIVACGYLAVYMQPWAGGIVFITVASYVPLTVLITERRGVVRKKMNALDNAREGRATDMLLNYETVKYFTNEQFELRGYDNATIAYQAMEYLQMVFLSVLSIVQSSVVWIGLAAGMVVCVYGVTQGTLTVGDAVLFVTMVNQLYVPLTFFGSYYRQVQKALIDMENMFELLHTVPMVKDAPDAKSLVIREGKVEFRDVTFGYNSAMPVLKGVSFGVPGGKTMAVVGATGSGKSTILRLLLRFYDPQGGAVLIDDQDISKASQDSVRGAIAVVPQDTVLFNDTIGYNIRYGRTKAHDAEVVAAARVAHIHSAIASFKKGYNTKVGERGLRLSGGEKQRVAFARAVLKKPAILILDEATSALDSLTELAIQSSLAEMRNKCTTVIVAHRLSTILDADVIVVLSNGLVAQVGSHSELLKESGGLYAAMWSRQGDSVPSANELLHMQEEQAQRVKATDAAAAARMVMQGTPPEVAVLEASEAGKAESAAAAAKSAKLEAARSSSSGVGGSIDIRRRSSSTSQVAAGLGSFGASGSAGAAKGSPIVGRSNHSQVAAALGGLGTAGSAGSLKGMPASGEGGRRVSLDAVSLSLLGLAAQQEAADEDERDGRQGSSDSSSGGAAEASCSTSGAFAAASAQAGGAAAVIPLPQMHGPSYGSSSSQGACGTSSSSSGANGGTSSGNGPNGADSSSSGATSGRRLRSSINNSSVSRKHVGFSRFVDPHVLPPGMAGTLGSSPGSSVILDIGEAEDDSSRRPTPGRRHNERLHPARYDSSADLTAGVDDEDEEEDSGVGRQQETAARARELILRDGSMPRLPGFIPESAHVDDLDV